MGKGQARVTVAATLVALYAAWHLTGGMQGTVFRLHTPTAVAPVGTTAIAASQCKSLSGSTAASPSATPVSSPSPLSSASICVNVLAAQDSIKRGKTATWTIQVSDRGGPATSVTVTVSASPAGFSPVFTGSCPSGGGASTCTVGDMGTAVTPTSYQLQAQIAVPAASTASMLTLVASADTDPPLTAVPDAGQSITVTGAVHPAKPAPSAVRTGALPTQAPGAAIGSSPAADVQADGGSSAAAPAGESFSIRIGMSARTAQILGLLLVAIIITLVASRLVSRSLSGGGQSRQPHRTLAQPAPVSPPQTRQFPPPDDGSVTFRAVDKGNAVDKGDQAPNA
jgi:hypothetical protein